jgi:hypothetical protein
LSASVTAQGTYSGGTGEPNTPYLIADANDMNEIGENSDDWDAHFLLVTDINLIDYNQTNFNLIGNSNTKFTGVFDGNGFTISNFTWNSPTADYIGLFGFVDDPNAEIKEVRLIDPNVRGRDGVGALVGYLGDGTITGCSVEGGVVSGDTFVGGLTGFNNDSTTSNCYATGTVSGHWWVGGLTGLNDDSIISNCYAAASVSGDFIVGGLTGLNDYGTISNCYAEGSVTGVGGLVGLRGIVGGLIGANSDGTISNCYAEGSVSGTHTVGGLVGLDDGLISNCYAKGDVSGDICLGGLVARYSNTDGSIGCFWDVNTSGQTTSAGGTGKSTLEMQTETTFTDAGWDFVGETANGTEDIWIIDVNDYPKLWWQRSDPLDLLIELSDNIDAMTLPKGIADSLQAKLNTAWEKLEDDNEKNDAAAINSLKAFINAVQANSGKKISQENADSLIEAAQQIIDILSD